MHLFCHACNTRFRNNYLLVEHLRIYGHYCCKKCSTTFQTLNSLKAHSSECHFQQMHSQRVIQEHEKTINLILRENQAFEKKLGDQERLISSLRRENQELKEKFDSEKAITSTHLRSTKVLQEQLEVKQKEVDFHCSESQRIKMWYTRFVTASNDLVGQIENEPDVLIQLYVQDYKLKQMVIELQQTMDDTKTSSEDTRCCLRTSVDTLLSITRKVNELKKEIVTSTIYEQLKENILLWHGYMKEYLQENMPHHVLLSFKRALEDIDFNDESASIFSDPEKLERASFYQILKIKRDASVEDITKSYRKLALQYHSDKCRGDDTIMKKLNEARDTLLNSASRDQYDLTH